LNSKERLMNCTRERHSKRLIKLRKWSLKRSISPTSTLGRKVGKT
jgi:hypothetical protein